MVSGPFLWVFIVVGLALIGGAGTVIFRRLLARRRGGIDLLMIGAGVVYAAGGAMLIYALFPASVF